LLDAQRLSLNPSLLIVSPIQMYIIAMLRPPSYRTHTMGVLLC